MDYTNMFDSYLNQDPDYVPDNMHPLVMRDTGKTQISTQNLHTLVKGNCVCGYWWYKGENISIPIDLGITVSVEQYALLSDVAGEQPGLKLPGFVGQRFYNLADVTSWTMTDRIGDNYRWQKDPVFTHPNDGEWLVKLQPSMDKFQVVVELLNFRYEPIFTKTYEGSLTCNFTLGREEQMMLPQGVYTLQVSIQSATTNKRMIRYDIQIR